MINTYTKKQLLIYLTIYIVIFLILITIGVKTSPDSNGYINLLPQRSALYPLIIHVLGLIFGTYNLFLIVIIQISFGIFSVYYFTSYFVKEYKIPFWLFLTISLFLASPFIVDLRGNYIFTESLSYSLFLINIRFLFYAILHKDDGALYKTLLISVPLILLRGQFYFLIPIYVLSVIYINLREANKKKIVLFISLILLVILSSNLLDKIYHYYFHDSFNSTPYTGIQIFTNSIYISKKNDMENYPDLEIQNIFNEIHAELDRRNLLLSDINVSFPGIVQHYTKYYSIVCHEISVPIISDKFPVNSSMDSWLYIDDVSLKIAFNVIHKNLFDFFKLYTLNIIYNGFYGKLYFILFIFIFVISFWVHIENKDKYSLLILFMALLTLMNFFLVALVEPVIERYAYYTNNVYIMSIVLLIYNSYKNIIFLNKS